MFYFINFEDTNGVYIFAKNKSSANQLANKVEKKFDDPWTEVVKVNWKSDKKVLKPLQFELDKYEYLIDSFICEIEAIGLEPVSKFKKKLFKDLIASFSDAIYLAKIAGIDVSKYKKSKSSFEYDFDFYTSEPL